MGVCNCSLFCFTLLYVHSSIAIILMGKRELVALLDLSSWCLVMVGWLFPTVPWGCLLFMIVIFPDDTHYFQKQKSFCTQHILVDLRVKTAAIYFPAFVTTKSNNYRHFNNGLLFLKCWLIIQERIGKATCKTVTSGQAILNIVFIFFKIAFSAMVIIHTKVNVFYLYSKYTLT